MFDITNAMPLNTEKLFKTISECSEINDFTLVGGTALSLHIKHRTSEDLDFFINKNKINTALQHKIDDLHDKLREKGYIVKESGVMDEYQQDYNISGVKVTYCITSSTDLKMDVVKYGEIDIASKDAIAAMKMFTVLKHRIKSRDFYDIKYLMQKEGYTFQSLLEKLQIHFPKYFNTHKKIEKRFLTTDLNEDDEGFEALQLKHQETFDSLRNYFKNIIFQMAEDEISFMTSLKSDSSLISENPHKKFSLSNKTLAMKLLEYKDFDNFKLLVKESSFNPLIKDMEGESIFNYLANENELELFDECLMLVDTIPENLPEQLKVLGTSDDFLEMIERHKLVNRCLKKDSATIDTLIKQSTMSQDDILKRIEKKRKILSSRI